MSGEWINCEAQDFLEWKKEAIEFVEAHIKDEISPVFESQVGGDHYKKLGVYQPWIVLHKWLTKEEFRGAIKATASIYLAREKDKGGRSDMEKAYHTIGIYLELTKGEDE